VGDAADMPNEPPPLTPADPDDLRRALAFALTFDGRRQFRTSGEMMARITAERGWGGRRMGNPV
jgi:hypothetical protein